MKLTCTPRSSHWQGAPTTVAIDLARPVYILTDQVFKAIAKSKPGSLVVLEKAADTLQLFTVSRDALNLPPLVASQSSATGVTGTVTEVPGFDFATLYAHDGD